jgi:heat shock protein HslJ
MLVAVVGCRGTPAPARNDSAAVAVPPPAAGATPWEKAGARGVEFRALGQEPGWTLELDQGRSMEYTGDYGNTKFATPAPEPVVDTATRAVTYSARTEAHTLVVGGVAALPAGTQREAHIRIDLEGRHVKGSTGCNSLSGPVTIDTQTIRFGPLATTRAACADTALARQERELVAALGAANRFIVADGHLTLSAGDRRVARFAAVYLR